MAKSNRGKGSLASQISKLRTGRYKVVLKSWKKRGVSKSANTRYKRKVAYKKYLYVR